MLKTDTSLRSIGYTLIAVHLPTRAKLKRLAENEGLPLCHYLGALADRELKGKPQAMAFGQLSGSEAGIASVKADTTSILKAVCLILGGWNLTKKELAQIENSPLSFLTDKAIINATKAMGIKVLPVAEQRGLFSKEPG